MDGAGAEAGHDLKTSKAWRVVVGVESGSRPWFLWAAVVVRWGIAGAGACS